MHPMRVFATRSSHDGDVARAASVVDDKALDAPRHLGRFPQGIGRLMDVRHRRRWGLDHLYVARQLVPLRRLRLGRQIDGHGHVGLGGQRVKQPATASERRRTVDVQFAGATQPGAQLPRVDAPGHERGGRAGIDQLSVLERVEIRPIALDHPAVTLAGEPVVVPTGGLPCEGRRQLVGRHAIGQ